MANVLVTGASGFLGSAVVARLVQANHKVIGLDPGPVNWQAHRHIHDDLSSREELSPLLTSERITHVLHCGGVSGPMVLPDQPYRVIETNVLGSLNLLGAAIDTGVRTFIQSSSVSAIGEFYEPKPIDDDYPLRPTTTYGCSKAAIDMVLRGLWRRLPLDLCSLRFTGIYGPGRQTAYLVDDIVHAVVRGEPYTAGAMTDWPYIYIDDAADAVVAACFSTKRQQLFYYIAYPQQISVKQLADAAAKASRQKAHITLSDGPPHAARGPLDIAPAQRDFAFAPMVDHHEGVRRMVDDMLARNA